jgi:hypothetical protein
MTEEVITQLGKREWGLTKKESEVYSCTAIWFAVYSDGNVVIRESWDHQDEIWSDGIGIEVPARIWKDAMKWMATLPRV